MVLFLLFVIVPMVEIALFVTVGGRIGLWSTLAIVVTTALIGSIAIRSQGMDVLRRTQNLAEPDAIPNALLEGLLLVVAGVLLVTPGFLTDVVGLSLLAPPVRRVAAQRLARHVLVFGSSGAAARGGPFGARRSSNAGARPDSAATARPNRPPSKPGATTDIDEAVVISETPASAYDPREPPK